VAINMTKPSFLNTIRDYRRFTAFRDALANASAAAGVPSSEGLFFWSREEVFGANVRLQGTPYLNFSSYDYLGAAQHPSVIEAATHALARQGAGAGASRVVAGQTVEHERLDRALALLLGCQDCLTFNAGFLALSSTVGFLAQPRDLILHDGYMHKSSLEGIQTSGATARAFRHNDVTHLRELLATTPCAGTTFVLVEGVYSMDGDVCPLDQIVELKKEFAFELIVDEAHSLGVLGRTGRGIAEHFNLPRDSVTLWMGTMSKALGACGGYAAGDAQLIEYLRHRCPGFVYSAGMPPSVAASATAAIELMQYEPDRVQRLQQLSRYAFDRATDLGLNVGHAQGTAILPVILGADESAFFASTNLFSQGIYVHPLGFPAAPRNAARLRFFLTAHHQKVEIERALELVAEVAKEAICSA
jgi:8-amino-7-oxononanoate synthase